MRKDIEKYVIGPGQTIRQAMVSIDNNWQEVTFVEDHARKLIGVITDGDIRRGLLRGLSMNSPAVEVMNNKFRSVSHEEDRVAVLDMMKALGIRQMPVLDEAGKIIGIHFLRELLGAKIRPNSAIIMAGGKGMRLRPLTENCPKPMIMVAGRPILERVILHLVGSGIREIFIAVNYLGHMIEEHFGDGARFGCAIHYIREDQPLGTGGALSLLPESLTDPVVVMNGDHVTQVDINKMLEFHKREQVEATIGAQTYQVEIPYGVLEIEGERLVSLTEKPTNQFLINTGIYVLSPSVLPLVPANTEFPITELFERLLAEQRPIGVHHIEEDWIDVGRHEELHRARGMQ